MNKQAYLEQLRLALQGLPPHTVAAALADYEQRFIDGLVAGRGESEIYQELEPPRQVAMALRTAAHLDAQLHGAGAAPAAATPARKRPFHLLRTLGSLIGLVLFNLFMVIPAAVYASLLAAVYISAFAFYIGGIALVSSGLSGQNELALEGPLRHIMSYTSSHFDSDEEQQAGEGWRMTIDSMGVQLHPDTATPASSSADENLSRGGRLLNRAEAVAAGDLHITTDFDNGARTTQSLIGFGLILGGIGFCLLGVVLSRYTMLGLKRYAAANLSLLRGH
ncbi:DUF1700 domain-containing protein [Duganella qianjiadongensis]|uniref:DUF1700 domain-containing protein n=1 Tax=Duganella qianjiadongensis TaxID=2692176 RepID=A0ABW9VPD3_9BURK|nr:DUF1700 domain-containing protein [Duganella qianjiadongensis]MYM39557.1 DUF1700 domain-containing protein [Duganella qianjiadongensis]